MNLLLEANSSEKLIRQYLVDGDLFTLTYKNEVACVAVVTKVDNDTCELKRYCDRRKNIEAKVMLKNDKIFM